jgi:hypothetical protein
VSSKSAGIFNTVRELQKNPNLYHYSRLNFVPTYTRRYFGVAAIGSVTQAAVSDGTNVDLRYSQDVGVAVGGAVPLAGNVIKVGTSLKGLIRNQIQGVFAHTSFQNEQSIRSQMQEGWGVGADIGVQITLPFRYLPTFAFVWQDIFGTHFRPIRILNSLAAQGKPASIAQTANVAFSLEPTLERGVKFLITAEFRHIERTDIPLMQRLHFGAQFEAFRNFYIWLGANQMYPTGGIGTRMPGGNLEFGTYAQDVAPGAGNAADRRILMRYTIGF